MSGRLGLDPSSVASGRDYIIAIIGLLPLRFVHVNQEQFSLMPI
jgi:hypothetical protein